MIDLQQYWNDKVTAAEHVVRHSRLASLFDTKSFALSGAALRHLRELERLPSFSQWSRDEIEQTVTDLIWESYGTWNPAMWAVLKILIPIVVRLVVNWWMTEMELRRLEHKP